MTVPSAYLTTTKNIDEILAAMQKAGVPRNFTYDFLKQLGYSSSSQRPVISVLKALGFLTDSGAPTERYRRFKEESQAPEVMAEALRDAYADVFAVDEQAHTKSQQEVKGIFARLSDKGESVNSKMATTFKALSKKADFSAPRADSSESEDGSDGFLTNETPRHRSEAPTGLSVHHDVHVHLPESTNIAVYDAIFQSLKRHLMS